MSHLGRSPAYLTRYNQVWYFRIGIPADLRPVYQKTELRISLGTPYLREARPAARKLAVETQLTFVQLRNGEQSMGGMTKDERQRLLLRYLREELDKHLRDNVNRAPDICLSSATQEPWIYYSKIEEIRKDLAASDYERIRDFLPFLLKPLGVEIDPESLDFPLLCHEFLLMELKRLEILVKRSEGDFDYEEQVLASLESQVAPSVQPQTAPIAVAAQQQVAPPAEPLVSVLVGSYIDEKMRNKDWKREKEFRPILELFTQAVDDPPINQLNPEAVRDFRKLIKDHYPSNWKKSKVYRDKSLATLKKAPIPEKDRMSDDRIKFYFVTINAFLSWAKDQAYDVHDSLTSILTHKVNKDKAGHEEVERFSAEDLKTIFHSDLFTQDKHRKSYQFWGPVIALFTGMRLEEICLIRLSDIRQEDGVWVFDLASHGIDDFKNATARRLVPIHDFLI